MNELLLTSIKKEEFEEIIESTIRKVLSENNQIDRPVELDLLDVSEAALFVKLAKPTIYFLSSQFQIPHMKKGKRLYFSRKELTEWLKSGKRKTMDEINEEASSFITSRKFNRSK
jgi:hypothetical protein